MQKIQYQFEIRILDLIVMKLAAAVYQAWYNFLSWHEPSDPMSMQVCDPGYYRL
jgi:hypothetical protein